MFFYFYLFHPDSISTLCFKVINVYGVVKKSVLFICSEQVLPSLQNGHGSIPRIVYHVPGMPLEAFFPTSAPALRQCSFWCLKGKSALSCITCVTQHVTSLKVEIVRNYDSFLGTFTKLRKANISFIISVRPSVRPNKSTRLPLDRFGRNLIFGLLSKICPENSNFIKIWQE
jgi:hypothetical protein